LVIAIDALPFGSGHCNEPEKWKGFSVICDEMIRFTHAYTPSILAQPTMTSLLTGQYPFEHGVWNNGRSYLSAKTVTSAELAYQEGYRTIFISGGPPIWKKSGLDQGFEFFDDNIFVGYRKYYRPAFENFRIFRGIVQQGAKDRPFFSFIYLADLQFPDIPTVGSDGYARETTYSGQLQAVDEALANFFEYLKENNYWKNTWIFVVGLNGLTSEARQNDFRGTDLFHENTNIAMFVKPPQKNEHDKFSWTIDVNISLVDLGRTLKSLLGESSSEGVNTPFKTISIQDLLSDKEGVGQDRVILMESGWPQWRKVGRSLFALQKDNYFLLYDNPPKLYNTLIDRNQVYPMDVRQSSNQILTDSALQLVHLLGTEEKSDIDTNIIQKYRNAHLFFQQKEVTVDVLYSIKYLLKKTKDIELAGWLARYYLQAQNWKELLALGVDWGQQDWIWAASKNLNIAGPVPLSCVGIFDSFSRIESIKDFDSVCSDTLTQSFFSWMRHRRDSETVYYQEGFRKLYKIFQTDLDIEKLNMENGYTWDVLKSKISRPQNIELILSLPEMQRYKKMLDVGD